MRSRLFSSFIEANKFAKSMTIKSGRSAKVLRHGDEWLVEFVAGGESSVSAAPQEVGASVPQQDAAQPIVENNAQITQSVLLTSTTSVEEAAKSIMSELKAIKLELDAEDKTKQKVKLERINEKLRTWEAEAPLRAAQAEEHKQKVSELSYKGGANKNKLCPICGYSLVPNSSSSHYCKCQRHTNYGINEGIAGTREENKKMRGQPWGDMRSRGRSN